MQQLRFLHIPKTAGTTFAHILNKQYCQELTFQFTGDIKSDVKRFNSLSANEQCKIALFTGHAPVFTGVKYIDSIDVVTFLREPVSRVKSFCQHVSEGKSPYLTQQFPPENFDLDKFLNSNILELHNLQTKMLLNTGASAIDIKVPLPEAVATAFNNLTNHLSAYGLVEYFDESLILFKHKFNWALLPYKISNQKNKNKLLEFKPHHIEKIKLINSLDIELYQQAKEEFLGFITDESFNENDLKKYRKINKTTRISPCKYPKRFLAMINNLFNKLT